MTNSHAVGHFFHFCRGYEKALTWSNDMSRCNVAGI